MASRFPRACKQQINYEETGHLKGEKVKKLKYNKNTLYDVKIIKQDAVKKRTKVHYVGYNSRYDEWLTDSEECPIAKIKKSFIPAESSFIDRRNIFIESMLNKIKQSLISHRYNDPLVTISIQGNQDIFQEFMVLCTQKMISSRTWFVLNQLSDFDAILERNWNKKIGNRASCFVHPGSFRFSL